MIRAMEWPARYNGERLVQLIFFVRGTGVQILKKTGGVILLLLAVLLLLVGFGVMGGRPKGDLLDSSSEAFARLIGGFIPAIVLAAGRVWLLQKRKS